MAYVVCQHFGIDTSEYSFGYVATWSSGKDARELKASLETIRQTASTLISDITGRLPQLQMSRGVLPDRTCRSEKKPRSQGGIWPIMGRAPGEVQGNKEVKRDETVEILQ